jgi:F0F1-type ATP synthase alpha subunit
LIELRNTHKDTLESIRTKKALDDETKQKLVDVLGRIVSGFKA